MRKSKLTPTILEFKLNDKANNQNFLPLLVNLGSNAIRHSEDNGLSFLFPMFGIRIFLIIGIPTYISMSTPSVYFTLSTSFDSSLIMVCT
jgi:hypothetical protein